MSNWVRDAIQPSHPLSSPSPPVFNLFQHQGLSQWVGSSHQVAKVLELQLQHQSFQWIGLIFFRVDWFDLLAVQGTLRSLLQHHSWRASILQHSAFFMAQLSYPYMTTKETVALTIWTFVGKVISLHFKTPSRFVIAFLPRSKCLLISCLQSPSAVILEAKIIRVKETSGNSPAPSSMWRRSQEMAVYEPGRLLPPHIESAGALSWIPQSPELLEIDVCCL